jgi:exodeoxyribonuclease VII large subunit
VARAIFESTIPLISAIGHQTDFTIADFTADVRAATPSVSAEIAVPLKHDINRLLEDIYNRIDACMLKILDSGLLRIESKALSLLKHIILLESGHRAALEAVAKTVTASASRVLEAKSGELALVSGVIEAMSPLAVLNRGYSLTYKNDNLIRNTEDVETGDLIKTTVLNGEIISLVKHTCEK